MKIGNMILHINNKKRAYPILVGITVLIILTIFMFFPITKVKGTEEPQYIEYTVERGDSIWSIAQSFSSEDTNIREFVYNITKLNNKTNEYIYVGELLRIPME